MSTNNCFGKTMGIEILIGVITIIGFLIAVVDLISGRHLYSMVENIYNRLNVQPDSTLNPTQEQYRKSEPFQTTDCKDISSTINYGEKTPAPNLLKIQFQDVKPIVDNLLEKNNISFMNIRQINENCIRFDLNESESDDVTNKIEECREYIENTYGWKIDYHTQ